MNRPDCDESSDSADKLANKQAELPSSVTTDDGLSEAEDPESDNFDHHAGLSKAKALAMTAILGKNDHAAGDPSEAAGSPVPYPEVKDDDPDSDWEQRCEVDLALRTARALPPPFLYFFFFFKGKNCV